MHSPCILVSLRGHLPLPAVRFFWNCDEARLLVVRLLAGTGGRDEPALHAGRVIQGGRTGLAVPVGSSRFTFLTALCGLSPPTRLPESGGRGRPAGDLSECGWIRRGVAGDALCKDCATGRPVRGVGLILGGH
jgi:hypothetical protein